MWNPTQESLFDDRPAVDLVRCCRPQPRRILERALAGDTLSVEDGELLLGLGGKELIAAIRTADEVRAADVGNEVTYVLNRNINWTNVCFVGCQFCGFARHRKDPDAYHYTTEEILARVQEAVDRGVSEVCMQGGIHPETDGFAYRDLIRAVKDRFPALHIHAFSPMEILYGARRAGMSHRDYLVMLREAGLDSIPGTAAEILDDELRQVLSHKKIDVRNWLEIVTTAHGLGIRSSATVMYGHIETPGHVARHTALLRQVQERTGGFTEYVPLRFVHTQTRLYQTGRAGEPPPLGLFDLRMYAFCRLMLRGSIDNIQTSWVKLGPTLAQTTLRAGCNDFGGTLMEESITRAAGGQAGESLDPARIRELIAAAGRVPIERTTTYGRRDNDGPDADHGTRRRGGSGTISPRAHTPPRAGESDGRRQHGG